jgi:tetratricopeptide (TPR) repeat protein
MRTLSRLLGASALALSITASGLAFGDATSTAENLFQQGLDAMKRNQFKEACDAFAGSNEADASPGTEINLALCNEKQGKIASAWGWYRTAAGLAELKNQKERAELARAEAAKLEPKLHKLVISVKYPSEGLVVTRNSAAVPAAALGTEDPIDPGDYLVEVKAKGKQPWRQKVHIAAGPGVDRVEVPALEDGPPEPKGSTPGADYTPPAGGGRDGTTQRNVGLVVGGAGIVAGIAAIAVQFLALSEQDKRTNASDDKKAAEAAAKKGGVTLTPEQVKNFNERFDSHDKAAKSDQLIAVVTGAAGVVMIGVGITLILTAPSSSKSADLTKPRLYPLLGNGTAGFGLTGSF